jgi:hypothetical protein
VGKKEHSSPANQALMLERYHKTHRFVPLEKYRRIDDFTEGQLRAIVARLREEGKEDHADILELFRREKFVTLKTMTQHFTRSGAFSPFHSPQAKALRPRRHALA